MKKLYFSDLPKNSGGICILETVYTGGMKYVEHSHDFYEIFFITEESLTHSINGKSMPMRKNMMYLIRPGDVHSFISGERGARMTNIAFSDPFIRELCPRMVMIDYRNPVLSLTMAEMDFVLHQIDQMKKIDMTDSQIVYGMNCAIVLSLFSIILTHSSRPVDFCPPWLSKAVESIGKDERYLGGIKKLVELSGVSQEHLTREMRKHYGITPTKLINQYRLEHARRLMLEGSGINAAALSSGFSNVTYFNRLFHNAYDCTPTQYRSYSRL
ncbi:MAG: helix-turn-helix transcriptional regulator [Firmicutes bacterium]|nr:helix-turn-helix transcriptional regulator [Bacillota bacterium]